MPITFHPKLGTVLMCDYSGFRAPEMVKKRPVVVVSRKHRELATVVPLSGTEPVPLEKCHHEMRDASLPPPFRGKAMWAKCDLITTVAFHRLDRVRSGKHPTTGKRMYCAKPVCPEDLTAIQEAVLHVLGLSSLTK
ncbi:MAG: type II toxin-antitoxin system PemK/MazF family toxin [Planctomycetota bacterium]